MKFEMSIPENVNYIHIRILEPMDMTLALELLAEVVKVQKKHGLKRFLLDHRKSASNTSPVDDYEIAYSEAAQAGFDRSSKVALLRKPSDKTHSFIETVGLNAGYKVSIFDDMNAAIKWLQE